MVVKSAEPPERAQGDPTPVGVVVIVAVCFVALFVMALSIIAIILFTVRCAWEAGAQ